MTVRNQPKGLMNLRLILPSDQPIAATEIFGGRIEGIRGIYVVWHRCIVPETLSVMLVLYMADSTGISPA